MKTIYKYELAIDDTQELMLPEGAEILTVQMQDGYPRLWALVDPHAPKKRRYIDIYGTGHPVGDKHGQYLGTFQEHGGQLVWHVFERTQP
jgi:hypothetical protein